MIVEWAYSELDTVIGILEFLRRCLRVERDVDQVVYRLCSEEPPIDGGSLFVDVLFDEYGQRRTTLLRYIDAGRSAHERRTEVRLPYDAHLIRIAYTDGLRLSVLICRDASLSTCYLVYSSSELAIVRVDDMYYVCLVPETT